MLNAKKFKMISWLSIPETCQNLAKLGSDLCPSLRCRLDRPAAAEGNIFAGGLMIGGELEKRKKHLKLCFVII